ncbi:hypothetical protein [uncultured Ruegeria sp.]|uniref:hypothetical protein n=1 Tax=uncultured Ruegeria sp. TaxID=259304 RepID=UPI0026192E51|nr:hypothetical protein [uncultured Ruegeria sp.]
MAAVPDHPRGADGFIDYAETVEGTRLIYLDTTTPRAHAGHFCPTRRNCLAAELKTCDRARIFVHHNVMPLGLPAEDNIALIPEDHASLARLLTQHRGRIDYIHLGHVLHSFTASMRHSLCSVRSTGNQFLLDLSKRDLLQGAPMAPSYCVIVADEADTVIHEIPFTRDGPIFNIGTAWDDWAKSVAAEGNASTDCDKDA